MPSAFALFRPGEVVAGRYEILAPIGDGAMAVVFRAKHRSTGRPCALKFIHPHLVSRQELVDQFLAEALVAGRIGSHPNIVDVFDAGVEERRRIPFIAMELLQGQPLAAFIKERAPVAWDVVRDVMAQLGDALDEAHSAGVVHRDLKPSNIFVAEDRRGRLRLKVLDFGIAKLLDLAGQSTATQTGTPSHCAPEQLGSAIRKLAAQRGFTISKTVSPATDVFPTALIAYRLLTGLDATQYWEARSLPELMTRVALEEHRPATERAGARAQHLPPSFDSWFLRCLRHNSEERWQGVGQAVAALARLLQLGPEAEPIPLVQGAEIDDEASVDSLEPTRLRPPKG
ncbi:MAG: serine/threonine protein kinase [Deltaproteobacteria bacterium]|nr:serine/threonine protein kinase [Deltaproteobacteria bacterium]